MCWISVPEETVFVTGATGLVGRALARLGRVPQHDLQAGLGKTRDWLRRSYVGDY